MSQPVIIKNNIVYGYMDKATVCRDMGREDYNDLTEAQQLNGDVYFIQGVDASAFAPTNSLWNKVGTTPLDSELPADCSQAINQLKSDLTWKYFGEVSPTSAGTIDIDIPTGAREIYVYSTSVKAPIIINCAVLDATEQWFQSGFYLQNVNNGGIAVRATNTKINYQTQFTNNAYASGTIKFYYR